MVQYRTGPSASHRHLRPPVAPTRHAKLCKPQRLIHHAFDQHPSEALLQVALSWLGHAMPLAREDATRQQVSRPDGRGGSWAEAGLRLAVGTAALWTAEVQARRRGAVRCPRTNMAGHRCRGPGRPVMGRSGSGTRRDTAGASVEAAGALVAGGAHCDVELPAVRGGAHVLPGVPLGVGVLQEVRHHHRLRWRLHAKGVSPNHPQMFLHSRTHLAKPGIHARISA